MGNIITGNVKGYVLNAAYLGGARSAGIPEMESGYVVHKLNVGEPS